jgi:hypothetical protein
MYSLAACSKRPIVSLSVTMSRATFQVRPEAIVLMACKTSIYDDAPGESPGGAPRAVAGLVVPSVDGKTRILNSARRERGRQPERGYRAGFRFFPTFVGE